MTFQANVTNKTPCGRLCNDKKVHQCKNQNPCDSDPPCNNCSVIESPPHRICEDVYCPEVQYEPVRPTVTCHEKPKKSFWQQLFGDRCLCFKSNCRCKSKKKAKPKITQEIKCPPAGKIDCCPCPPPVVKPNKVSTLCKADAKPCPQRVCHPPPHALCGCHFYFNIGKIPRHKGVNGCNTRTKTFSKQCNNNTLESCVPDGKRSSSPPPAYCIEVDPRNSLKSQYATAYKGDSRCERVTFCEPAGCIENQGNVNKVSRLSNGETEQNPSSGYRYSANKETDESDCYEDGIHFGVTVTKEETKYLPAGRGGDVGEQDESSEEILTLGIRKSGLKVDKIEDQHDKIEDRHDKIEDRHSTSEEEEITTKSNKRRSIVPRSESYNLEIEPLLRKKKRISEKYDISEYDDVTHAMQNNYPKGNLHKRVSEIFKKLDNIEKKIKVFEQIKTANKNIKIDIDGQESTVSVHLKDGYIKDTDHYKGTQDHRNSNQETDAVIEITQKRFKSQSPCRNNHHPESERHNNECSSKYEKNNQEKQTFTIKIPNGNNKIHVNHQIQPSENEYLLCSANANPNDHSTYSTTWCHIANCLKMNSTDYKCYCVTCCSEDTKRR